MLATFLIMLREAFEAALLLGIVYTYLQKIGAQSYYRYATWGAVLGVLASMGVGVAVSYLSGPLLDIGPDLVGAAVIFVSVVVLTWILVWMRQHARAIKSDVQRRVNDAVMTRRFWLIGLVAFTGGMLGLAAASALWDTSSLLSDHSFLGALFNGLLGYRAQPTLLAATAYVAYLPVAGSLLFGDRLFRHLWPSAMHHFKAKKPSPSR